MAAMLHISRARMDLVFVLLAYAGLFTNDRHLSVQLTHSAGMHIICTGEPFLFSSASHLYMTLCIAEVATVQLSFC